MSAPDAVLALLQLSDGLFPAGAFAHSFGLETYAQDGRVRTRTQLEAFMTATLEGSAGPTDAVAVALAGRAAAAGALAPCLDVDARIDAMRWVPELRAASRQMGRQTARIAAAIDASPVLAALEAAVEEERTPGHHAVAFGAACGAAGVEPAEAALAFLYATCAMLAGAALRLMPLGQREAQRALAAMRPCMGGLAARAAAAGLDDMWSFTPALELASLAHAHADGRLFRS